MIKKAAIFFATMFSVVILFNVYSAIAQSKDHYPIGKIVQIEGSAYYSNGENRRKLKVDDPVFLYSTVETDKDSKILIIFVDDTQLRLAENTILVIDEYVFDPYDSEENKAGISVTKGAFNWLSGQITKRETPQVDIKTPVGSIGIRGTEFWAGELQGGYGVFVSDGLVGCAGDFGQVDMAAGDGVFISETSGQAMMDGYWDSPKMAAAMQTVTFSDAALAEERTKTALYNNIQERENYRSAVFPNKPKPSNRKYIGDQDDFFTDEFEQLRDRR